MKGQENPKQENLQQENLQQELLTWSAPKLTSLSFEATEKASSGAAIS